jgi:ribosomal protein L29
MADPKATPAPGGAEAEKAAGNKKINKMTPAEIDAKLNELKTSQGGLKSRYAKQLIQHKKSYGS